MQSVLDFYKKQTLVIFRRGQLGSFFMNLMMADDPNYDNLVKSIQYGLVEDTGQWLVYDYFSSQLNGLVSNYVRSGLPSLNLYFSHKIKSQLEEKNLTIYEILFLRTKLNSANKPVHELSFNEILDLLNQPIDYIKFPFVRASPQVNLDDYQQAIASGNKIQQAIFDIITNWSGLKVFCYFPEDKQWISSLLECYETSFVPSIKFNRLILDQNFDDWRLTADGLIKNFETDYLDFPKINMYKVVFEKDLSDVYKIFPNFVLTEKKQKLLDLAHFSQLKIMQTLQLDHTNDYCSSRELYYDLLASDFFLKYVDIFNKFKVSSY